MSIHCATPSRLSSVSSLSPSSSSSRGPAIQRARFDEEEKKKKEIGENEEEGEARKRRGRRRNFRPPSSLPERWRRLRKSSSCVALPLLSNVVKEREEREEEGREEIGEERRGQERREG